MATCHTENSVFAVLKNNCTIASVSDHTAISKGQYEGSVRNGVC